ncbi:MAG: branched-chain amino acid ABC transporter permease [Actinomycetota bacterium]
MANASTPVRRTTAVRMSAFERLPIRRIILTVLSVAIAAFVIVGSYKTLTLPESEAYSWETWRDIIARGVSQGAILALIALGYTLVYGILRMINFAHGEVFMMGAYGSFFFAEAYARSGFLNSDPVAALLIIVGVAVAVSVGVAVLLERIAYRPLRNAPRLVPLITAIGASLFLQNTARGFFGTNTQGYPRPEVLDGTWTILGFPMDRIRVIVLLASLISMGILQYVISRTKTGRSMRAVAEDQEIASLMGIDVNRVVVKTFIIGGILAGIAGVLFALTFEAVNYFIGFRLGIAAFTAAVLGGIGSIGGAALGGFTLGILQAVGPPLLLTGFNVPSPFQLEDVVTFAVLVLVLIFRPGGLLGAGGAEKV